MPRRNKSRGRLTLADLPPHLQAQVQGQLEAESKPKPVNKFGVSPKEQRQLDGIQFDSKWEMEGYQVLNLKYGKLGILKLQPRYVLQEAFTVEGSKFRKTAYVADFEIRVNPKCWTIDFKGYKTPVFRLKEKLFAARYGRAVRNVRTKQELWDVIAEVDNALRDTELSLDNIT